MNRRISFCLLLVSMTIQLKSMPLPEVTCRSQSIEGVNIFYREAGPQTGPVLVLLHGFPTSSFYFRNLIPLLAGKYHIIAPDYPGFGHSDTPAVDKFEYTFEHEAAVMEKFLEAKNATNCVFYMQDYGAPIGMRIALKHPDWIAALVFQDGNVYEEGLLERFFLKKPLWEKRTGATEAPVLRNMELDAVKYQYLHGARNPDRISPDSWTMDIALMERPGNKAIQLELQADYADNLKKYPEWQEYLRNKRPPTLVVWGKNDPIFGPKGAEAFRRDVPDAEIHLLDSGHFALEEDYNPIADFMLNFLEHHAIQ
ncbi:MAG TPA: alpha/beta hydrolase [Verrucomicrobiae bacterium]|jgi:pimeloyl-ACP methyl ester carboxylesterase|nr:alpha/beta hydrolase [Verrucomicrobiae bacterium]